MSKNAFIAGVEPGGLTNDYEVRILICYILKVVKIGLNFEDFNNILVLKGIVNYFECTQSISELIHLGHIKLSKNEEYVLTKSGEDVVETFEKTLPLTVKEKTLSNAQKYLKYKNMEKDNFAEVEKVKDGYNITLNVKDMDSVLMKLTLFAPDKKYCDIIKGQFYNNPAQTYKAIIALLTGDVDSVYSILAQKILEKI